MRIVQPSEITADVLQSTNVVNIETTWTAGTYSLGVRRVYERMVYEVVASPSTADRPDIGAASDPPTWVALGYSNQWRMFTEGADSLSTGTGDIDVTLQWPGLITTIAALGLVGYSIRVTVTDSVDGVVFDQTKDLIDIGVSDWWEFFFLPYENDDAAVFELPPYPGADIRVLLEAENISDPGAVGRVVAGVGRDLGVTLYGTDIQLQDYSIKERDGFGNLILLPRRTLKYVNYDVHVPTDTVDFVVRALSRLGGIPTLYIGDPDKTSTVVFGVFADISSGIAAPSISDLTLQVEEF